MKKINIKQLEYRLQHRVLTINNIVIMVAFLVAAGWAIGSVGVLERNYRQQRVVDAKQKEYELARLQAATLEYQRNYYKSDEYKELAVRQRMGLALPGEKAIILSPNTDIAKKIDAQDESTKRVAPISLTNQEQWLKFFFGSKS